MTLASTGTWIFPLRMYYDHIYMGLGVGSGEWGVVGTASIRFDGVI